MVGIRIDTLEDGRVLQWFLPHPKKKGPYALSCRTGRQPSTENNRRVPTNDVARNSPFLAYGSSTHSGAKAANWASW